MNPTTSIEALADTIENMPDADTSASGGPTAPPGTVTTQKSPECGLCKRVFKFGDYVCVTRFATGHGTAMQQGILCKKCYGSGKNRAEARIVLFTNGHVSSVNRDRAWKRSKKLERMAKKQQKG